MSMNDAASVLSDVHDITEPTEFQDLGAGLLVSEDSNKKAKSYRAFLSRPNVHAGLHYGDVIEDYATLNNCTVWTGEDKHKWV